MSLDGSVQLIPGCVLVDPICAHGGMLKWLISGIRVLLGFAFPADDLGAG